MTGGLLINVTPSETRVALIENGVLQEVHVEREARRGLVGNIYLGKIIRVLPGMQAAFVDIGLDKAAFLHASDIHSKLILNEEATQESHSKGHEDVRDIRSLVYEGQYIMVQVVKDPMGTKGARLTTDITLPSRYLVLMPNATYAAISQRIDDADERNRLKQVVEPYCDETQGFIVRTAAEGASKKALKHDAEFLQRVWKKVLARKERKQTNAPIYQALSLAFRMLRDSVGIELVDIRVDSKLTYEQLKEFTGEFVPELLPVLRYYPGERPIFDLFNVENEIQKALQRKIPLKSGGSLIIDQTEAMTTIDINTGASVGHRNLEETIFNTNLEATQAIARQLRLRNLGGIIIVDFIDMYDSEHKRRVLHSLDIAMQKDHVKYSISQFSNLGLVEMTRMRTRESLEHILCGECAVCQGRGHLKTTETICYEILREIVRVNRAYDSDKFTVYASTAVSEALIDDEYQHLAELEVFIGKQIKIQTESLYNQEQFDVVMM